MKRRFAQTRITTRCAAHFVSLKQNCRSPTKQRPRQKESTHRNHCAPTMFGRLSLGSRRIVRDGRNDRRSPASSQQANGERDFLMLVAPQRDFLIVAGGRASGRNERSRHRGAHAIAARHRRIRVRIVLAPRRPNNPRKRRLGGRMRSRSITRANKRCARGRIAVDWRVSCSTGDSPPQDASRTLRVVLARARGRAAWHFLEVRYSEDFCL